MTFSSEQLQVYFICGTQDIPQHTTIQKVLTEALEAGITLFQFREKGDGALLGTEKKALAMELKQLCYRYHVPFIVNDDIELAKTIDADGIHVGQDDETIESFIQDFNHKIIGLSISDTDEYNNSDLQHVDYIGVGPMYATSSKDDAHTPVGPDMIRQLKSFNPALPIVAIGGIAPQNVKPIAAAGADGVSVISAIAQSDDIYDTVKELKQYFNK